ncbi:hypothetical protein [Arthrobacter pascens]|uniref:hypothetical protein n=1 Tax=Arthrobacter pascens TaxID=1677 RepID=UPI00196AF165|nr:hypothetical protein [Arthrobacter pascens]MBN3496706.1 hypothetical protein [Arthrobacter pascens]
MTVDEGHHSVHEPGLLPTVLHPDVAKVFDALDGSGLPWLLVRGEHDLARPSGDVDILVAREQLPGLDHLMAGIGFRRVLASGHGSHRFYFAYAGPDDLWLKLDFVSDISFGPYQQWRTALASGCLSRRVRNGPFWLPDPADQAWLQLLHLVLDKGEVRPERVGIASRAASAASTGDVIAEFLDRRVGPGAAGQLLNLVRAGRFDQVPAMAARMRSAWTMSAQRRPSLLAVANRAQRLLTPRLRGRAPVVGVMAPDGAGKTTLLRSLGPAVPLPSSYVYMGMWGAGPWDAWLSRIPGGRLGKKVFRLVRGGLAARYHSLRGRVVLMDRVAYDAVLPGSTDNSVLGRITNAMAFYLVPDPDVLLVLDAPGEVMFARKGEHSAEILEGRRQAYLQLADSLPQARVLDAVQPQDEVQRQATDIVWRHTSPGPASAPEAGRAGPVELNLHLWRLLDWRFLLPVVQPRSLGYGGDMGRDMVAALHLLDPGAARIGADRIEADRIGADRQSAAAGDFDVVLLSAPDLRLFEEAAAAVEPGGWVCAQVSRSLLRSSGPRTVGGWKRVFERKGFSDVAIYWHAPNLERTARIVPVASATAVRDTLSLQEAIRFRRSKVAIARLALALRLFDAAIPEGTVMGRRGDGRNGDDLH